MSKKVFELAKELGIGAVDLVDRLREKGFILRNHMQVLNNDEIEKLYNVFKQDDEKKKVSKKKVKKKTVKKTSKKVAKKNLIRKKAEHKKSNTVNADTAQNTQKDQVLQQEESTEETYTDHPTIKKGPTTVIRKKKDGQPVGLRIISRPESQAAPPERQEQKDVLESKTIEGSSPPAPKDDQESDSDPSKKGKKKRLSGLATMMSKKKMVSRSEIIAQQRSENELKSYSSLSGVGRPTYTQIKRKKIYIGPTKDTELTEIKESKRQIKLHGGATAAEIAKKLKVKFKDMADQCLNLNLLVNPDDFIGIKLAAFIGDIYQYKVENIAFDEKKFLGKEDLPDKKNKTLPLRNPVVAIMGHVDHGKTTLLDTIKDTKVATSEAGGITQHLGAYEVKFKEQTITFLDTPGHEAFASMRQRGANVTDVVILVVAADDGIMPQTRESIRFCQHTDKPIIVAVNKMDKEEANLDKIQAGLAELGLTPEQWGGDTQYVPISALKGEGIDELLESVSFVSEILELTANVDGKAEGVVLEAKIEQGKGPVATVLIQSGTLTKGDSIVVGESFGRARNLIDSFGNELVSVPPSRPVQTLGLNSVPSLGDILNVVKNEREAKKIIQHRIDERKKQEMNPKRPTLSLEDFFSSDVSSEEKKRPLNLIIRTDVQGSCEAIKQSLEALSTQNVEVKVIGEGTGPISDSDVHLAHSTKAIIIGFNMRPSHSARRLAEVKGIDIKTYSVIYELINDVKLAIEGLFDPQFVEHYVGRADVKETFSVPKSGVVAGTFVIDGKIILGHNMRALRNGQIIYDGKISSLKRFKDPVKEVKNNLECGIGLENFNDIKIGDTLECYIMEEKQQKYDDVVKKTLEEQRTSAQN